MSLFIVSIVAADGLTLLCAQASAGADMTLVIKFGSHR